MADLADPFCGTRTAYSDLRQKSLSFWLCFVDVNELLCQTAGLALFGIKDAPGLSSCEGVDKVSFLIDERRRINALALSFGKRRLKWLMEGNGGPFCKKRVGVGDVDFHVSMGVDVELADWERARSFFIFPSDAAKKIRCSAACAEWSAKATAEAERGLLQILETRWRRWGLKLSKPRAAG